ncbi:MAG: twin-arginine translocase subunit TatC [Proteobacteria bacterium]|nr:twin-arginine translocase subunit TatC [Cystobacterineae bacterium]MCL2259592.1 twin-arginine translocase subunit TatC [Cystobacterineae bacterium]MCL2313901.1 twin-arginine translocase subunit TatC [Pseudomonadota bacterium]
MNAQEPEANTMKLAEHLGELRTRLLRCVVSVLVLGTLSLVFSREIFGLLMKPVLSALPAASSGLIYTSAIEEINVFMKVGLYTGIFLTTPVILWQVWAFVSPGLYARERRLAAPFIVAGTLAFLVGISFCYLAVLPSMFRFLLNEESATETAVAIQHAELSKELALLQWQMEDAQFPQTVEGALGGLEQLLGWSQEVNEDAMQALLVSSIRLLQVVQAKQAAGETTPLALLQAKAAYERGELKEAQAQLAQAMQLVANAMGPRAQSFEKLWNLELKLAKAKTLHRERAQTRPMLSMKEQLSLILLLELAFGIIFELPVLMALLALVGLIKSKVLFKYQRHAIVASLIAAALITPTGDAVNLALMAVPMVLCYELGVLLVWVMEKMRRKSQEEAQAL